MEQAEVWAPCSFSSPLPLVLTSWASAQGGTPTWFNNLGQKRQVTMQLRLLMERLNVSQIVDYTEADSLADLIRSKHTDPFDAVYNCVGDSPLYPNSHKFLKPGGA